jgi:hypothetical protein
MSTTTITVNIGLNVGDAGPAVSTVAALRALQRVGHVTVLRFAVRESNTEPTLIAELNQSLTAINAFRVAQALQQDCIAQRIVSDIADVGGLYGPKAREWGPFNPQLFLGLDDA